MVRSIEEKVEEYFKSELDSLGIRHYGKTGEINSEITSALRQAESKSGGAGNNYPNFSNLFLPPLASIITGTLREWLSSNNNWISG